MLINYYKYSINHPYHPQPEVCEINKSCFLLLVLILFYLKKTWISLEQTPLQFLDEPIRKASRGTAGAEDVVKLWAKTRDKEH